MSPEFACGAGTGTPSATAATASAVADADADASVFKILSDGDADVDADTIDDATVVTDRDNNVDDETAASILPNQEARWKQ